MRGKDGKCTIKKSVSILSQEVNFMGLTKITRIFAASTFFLNDLLLAPHHA